MKKIFKSGDRRRQANRALRLSAGKGQDQDPVSVFQGQTTGTPIALLIDNQEDTRSKDYDDIKDKFRPGHADYVYWAKYGIKRLARRRAVIGAQTAMRVAAGAVARKVLQAAWGSRLSAQRRIGSDGTSYGGPQAMGLVGS